MNITVDVANGGNTVRGKLQTKMVEGKLYFLIESVTGRLENEILQAALSVTGKKWIMADAAELAQQMQDPDGEHMQAEMIGEFMRIDTVKKDSVGNTVYTLILTRDAARELSKSLREMSSSYISGAVAPRISARITVTLDKNNALIKATTDFSAEAGIAGLTGSFTVSRRSSSVTVAAPAGAVDIMTLGSSIPGFSDFVPSMDSSSEWDDSSYSSESSNWMNESDTNSWDSSSSEQPNGACTIAQMHPMIINPANIGPSSLIRQYTFQKQPTIICLAKPDSDCSINSLIHSRVDFKINHINPSDQL